MASDIDPNRAGEERRRRSRAFTRKAISIMGQEFDITQNVPRVDQVPAHRHSLPTGLRAVLEKLRQCEPISMPASHRWCGTRGGHFLFLTVTQSLAGLEFGRAGGQRRPRRAGNPPRRSWPGHRPCCTTTSFPSAERARLAEYLLPGAGGLDKVFLFDNWFRGGRMRPSSWRARTAPDRRPRKIGIVGASAVFMTHAGRATPAACRPEKWIVTRTRPSCRRPSRTVTGRRIRASICSWRTQEKGPGSGQRWRASSSKPTGSPPDFRAQRVHPGPGPMVSRQRRRSILVTKSSPASGARENSGPSSTTA